MLQELLGGKNYLETGRGSAELSAGRQRRRKPDDLFGQDDLLGQDEMPQQLTKARELLDSKNRAANNQLAALFFTSMLGDNFTEA
ncbi:MAG: hypothetical protein WCD76_06160 [Pyrinomonadaceae bacterium]